MENSKIILSSKFYQVHGNVPALPAEALRHADLDVQVRGGPGDAPECVNSQILIFLYNTILND